MKVNPIINEPTKSADTDVGVGPQAVQVGSVAEEVKPLGVFKKAVVERVRIRGSSITLTGWGKRDGSSENPMSLGDAYRLFGGGTDPEKACTECGKVVRNWCYDYKLRALCQECAGGK